MTKSFSSACCRALSYAAMIVLASSCTVNNNDQATDSYQRLFGSGFYRDLTLNDSTKFVKTSYTIEDGYRVEETHHVEYEFCSTFHLYSPDGKLQKLAIAPSESPAMVCYTIDYAPDGEVSCVNFGFWNDIIDDEEWDKNYTESMKYWTSDTADREPNETYEILRDANGKVTKIGTVDVPQGYKADYFLGCWGPFWESDLWGNISFFTVLLKEDTKGKYVNYVYCRNVKLLEMDYTDGTFTKARTYDDGGAMINEYEADAVSLFTQAYTDMGQVL